ncbi:MAG: 2Fe-2S iron-sulfur cluster-binding protein [Patescibacteria group bacterium]
MPDITFILQDGQVKKLTAESGKTVLQIALENGIPMEHACGGNGFCTTCSCEVQGGQAAIDSKAVSPVNEKEVNMGVEGPDTRLGCQMQVYGDVTVKPVEL